MQAQVISVSETWNAWWHTINGCVGTTTAISAHSSAEVAASNASCRFDGTKVFDDLLRDLD